MDKKFRSSYKQNEMKRKDTDEPKTQRFEMRTHIDLHMKEERKKNRSLNQEL